LIVRRIAAVAVALLAVPGLATAAPAKPHNDPADVPASAFDLTQVSLGQDAKALTLTLTTDKPWVVRQLSPQTGRSLCLLLFVKAATTRVCAVPATVGEKPLALRWSRLDAAGHPLQSRPVAGTVTHPDPRTLIATFSPAAAFLMPGTYRWRAQSRWVGGDGACPPGANPCTDYVPNGGSVPAHLLAPDPGLPTGCVASGPVELRSGPPGHKRIALTFDDGPANDTPQFLDLLERDQAVATFFQVGREVAGRTELLKRMLRDGDMIGNHTWAHADVSAGAGTQISSTQDAIRTATGFTPCLFRPPYGSTGPVLRNEVAALGMRSILWDVDPADWSQPGVAAIVNNVLANAHDGAIVISHDGGGPRGQTLAAYAQIIPALQKRGYQLVTVTDLLGLKVTHTNDAR
jgi:peptidoglycan/xylan/chitin deacetylase (PgdA/CDA1 family)